MLNLWYRAYGAGYRAGRAETVTHKRVIGTFYGERVEATVYGPRNPYLDRRGLMAWIGRTAWNYGRHDGLMDKLNPRRIYG